MFSCFWCISFRTGLTIVSVRGCTYATYLLGFTGNKGCCHVGTCCIILGCNFFLKPTLPWCSLVSKMGISLLISGSTGTCVSGFILGCTPLSIPCTAGKLVPLIIVYDPVWAIHSSFFCFMYVLISCMYDCLHMRWHR